MFRRAEVHFQVAFNPFLLAHLHTIKTISRNWMSIKCVFHDISEHAHHFQPTCYISTQRFRVSLYNVLSKENWDLGLPTNYGTSFVDVCLTCTKRAIWLANATKRCDTSCREGVTLRNVGKIPCNVAKRVAKSRTDFYFRNDCGNKTIATNVCSRVCYTRQYFVQLVSQQNCETSCKRNCLV